MTLVNNPQLTLDRRRSADFAKLGALDGDEAPPVGKEPSEEQPVQRANGDEPKPILVQSEIVAEMVSEVPKELYWPRNEKMQQQIAQEIVDELSQHLDEVLGE